MSNSTALVPIDQRKVEFYEDRIAAALVNVEGHAEPAIYVPVRPICEYLGVNWPSQYQRIQRDPVLSQEARGVVVTTTPGGQQEALCLPIEFLHGWLFGISAARVKPELRDKIIRYQHECYRVLWRAFQAEALAALGVEKDTSPLARAREVGLAIVQMAEQQMALEQRVGTTEHRLDQAAQVVGALGRELAAVKQRVSPGHPIADEQAAEISQKVMALAALMTEHEPGKNHYQGIFGELHRRFGVTSYKLIQMKQYKDVLAFLEDWRQSTIGKGSR